MTEGVPSTSRRRGRHAGAEEVVPAVAIVCADGSVHSWAADQPQARPFVALVDLLLARGSAPDLKPREREPMTASEGREHR
jgi:hypothetical protein